MGKKQKSSGAYMTAPVRSYIARRAAYVPPNDFPAVSLICIPTLGGEGSYSSLKIGATYNPNIRVANHVSAAKACNEMYNDFYDIAAGTKGNKIPDSYVRGIRNNITGQSQCYFEAWWPTQEELLIFLLKAKQELQAYVDLENNKR